MAARLLKDSQQSLGCHIHHTLNDVVGTLSRRFFGYDCSTLRLKCIAHSSESYVKQGNPKKNTYNMVCGAARTDIRNASNFKFFALKSKSNLYQTRSPSRHLYQVSYECRKMDSSCLPQICFPALADINFQLSQLVTAVGSNLGSPRL